LTTLPPTVDLSSIPVEPPPVRTIGPLWRRLAAFLLDGLLVGVAASLIALPFFEPLSRVGAWGVLIGFCLALPYYAIFNSQIGNGQTPGKRFMHLQVVTISGAPVSLARSFVRYAVFSLLYFLSGIQLPASRTPAAVSYSITAIIAGLGLTTIYLLLFNRRTGQFLHDLAVGSYVADAHNSGALNVRPFWKGHWTVLAVFFACLFTVGLFLRDNFSLHPYTPALMDEIRTIEDMDHVQAASLTTETNWSSGAKHTAYVVTVHWSGKTEQLRPLANAIAVLILAHNPNVNDQDQLKIAIIRGYDLGIANASIKYPFADTPTVWRTALQLSDPPPNAAHN
jgi:uncharacterized RDD family membrane protein YckC